MLLVRYTPALLLLLVILAVSTNAFVVQQRPALCRPLPSAFVVPRPALSMTAAADDSPDEASTVETDDGEQVTEITAEQDEQVDEPAAAAPAEDPEIVAIKEKIASMESRIKEIRRQVMLTSDQADEYTKEGYARKVAEMENMRRARSKLNSSSRSAATANLLSQFLPVLDRLEDLSGKYSQDAFGKQYNALPGAMRSAMSDMGVAEFEVKVGDVIDAYRMEVTSSEHSDTAPAKTVLRVESKGLDLDGNVMRKPKVVASLGPKAAVEDEAAEEGSSEADAPGETNED